MSTRQYELQSRPHRYNPSDFSSYPSDILSRTSSDFIVVNDLFFTSSPTIGFFLKRILPHPSRAKDKKRLKIHREKYNRSVIIMFTFTSAIFLNKNKPLSTCHFGCFLYDRCTKHINPPANFLTPPFFFFLCSRDECNIATLKIYRNFIINYPTPQASGRLLVRFITAFITLHV